MLEGNRKDLEELGTEMASATDIITYIGVPLAVLGVLPILYNAAQCLLIRHQLLQSLPAAAKAFFRLHLNPVDGTVVCSIKTPTFDFQNVFENVKTGFIQIDVQNLPYVELQGLGASWMRLIHALRLEPKLKKSVQRILVNSNLDVDPITMRCEWTSLVFLVLGLGVSPSDPFLHSLGGGPGADALSEKNLHSTALLSDTGQRLIAVRWYESLPYLELTEQCSLWSIFRSLAHFLHMIVKHESEQIVLHWVYITPQAGQHAILERCDCKDIISYPLDYKIFQKIHCAITWTFYFEELLHRHPSEAIPVPQTLLLFQFEVTEEFRQTPAETLLSQLSNIFPNDVNITANIYSVLQSIWDSSDYQGLLDGLGGKHTPKAQEIRRSEPNASIRPTQVHSEVPTIDLEKAVQTGWPTSSQTAPQNLDLYATIQSSPLFRTLSLAYSPSALINTNNSTSPSAQASISIDDDSKPGNLLARLVIALSTMRYSTLRKGWVTSIASGSLRYKVKPDDGENMVRKLMGYEGGSFRIE